MTSQKPGTTTSDVEVANIDSHGFWLFVKGHEYFLPYTDFPWFKEARLAEILNVTLCHDSHLRWPDLDVDLCLESLQQPDKFPLIYK
ncbi:DUF2442 domain-containing protein [Candidatus Sumerlaeota bacterium]